MAQVLRWRMVQAGLSGQRLPWIALLVGLLPVIGNSAYPVQLLHTSTITEAKLAQFIVYDTVTRFPE